MSRPDQAKVGTSSLIFLVMAAAAPLGFTVGTIPLGLDRGSLAYTLAILCSAVVLAIFAVGYVTMARHTNRCGGLYEFVREGLGEAAGTGAAFVAALTYALAGTGAIGVFALLIQTFAADTLSIHAAWWVWALAGTVAMGIMGILNTEFNARVLGIIIVIELAILVIVSAAVLFSGGEAGLITTPFEPSTLLSGSVGTAFALSIVAFAGFEATVIYSAEAKDRNRTLLRATVGSLAIMAALYAFVSWAIVAGLGPAKTAQVARDAPLSLFFVLTRAYVGGWMAHLTEFMVVTSWFASVVAFHNATARYLASMGSDRILPSWFGKVSERTGAPVRSSLVHTAISLFAVLLTIALNGNPYLDLFILGSTPAVVGIPTLEIVSSIAIIAFFLKDRRGHSVWVVLVAPAVAAILLSAILWQIVSQLGLFTGRGIFINALLQGVVGAVFIMGFVAGTMRERATKNGHQPPPTAVDAIGGDLSTDGCRPGLIPPVAH